MTPATYPQVRIVPMRFLNPDTVESLLSLLFAEEECGIRRIVLNGPSIPAVVPYGPARGAPNETDLRRTIKLFGEDYLLQIQVGAVLLELESKEYLTRIHAVCEHVFNGRFPYSITEGTYMRSGEMTTTDYAKYGRLEDSRILGMSDPKSKQRPIIIQDAK
ncbi:MAG TPA: methyl-coenzyme M reductase operon protein D [Methanocorpusculum sp.]|nr:methyl-coenzyme M reductase operon protein D [Methanocorpusculum sp.]HJK80993.1 methyl-coenzyme M reductase operon protein D [Methanocorpusculum sp.]